MPDPLAPFVPSRAEPWDRVRAAHLLRRAGFAPGEREIQGAIEAGPAETVARLVESNADTERHNELDELGERIAQQNDIGRLRGWWLLRMRHTARPLHARLGVFWHGHFATSNTKVNSPPLMLRQHRTLERLGAGPLEDLLISMARDPAMIIWLDGNDNVKGRPNENFAREFFELFSLGVGHYTEADIQESARAFTGWHQRSGRFRFVGSEHDGGAKTVLGVTGNLDGADIVQAALARPACSRFIAAKLLREFLCPDPPEDIIEAVAQRLRETDHHIGETLRTVLASRAMFDDRFYRARIKSPVEFALGAVRSLRMSVPAPPLADAVSQMGQRLFEPPSVKGWDGHRAWLNTATMLVRLNLAERVTAVGSDSLDPAALRNDFDLRTSEEATRFCLDLTLDGRAPVALQRAIAPSGGSLDETMRRALRLLLASPEYQMA